MIAELARLAPDLVWAAAEDRAFLLVFAWDRVARRSGMQAIVVQPLGPADLAVVVRSMRDELNRITPP